MKTKIELFKARGFCALVVAVGSALTPAATFSDANWISMGGLTGANGNVQAAVVDDSGNLYIGGRFNVVGDVIANQIAKWDGNRWTTLGSGMNDQVYALAVSGSDLYAGGAFTTAGGVTVNGIAKWDGTNWSALGSGMNGAVSVLAVSGGDLYALGYFTIAGGTAANYIAKWDGSNWSALGSGLGGNGGFPYLYALAVSGSDVFAGGVFTTAGGLPVNNIAEWDGSSWSAMGSGIPFGGNVSALAVSGSDLFVGGQFSSAGGVAATNIAKWNGTSWSAVGSGMDGQVWALVVSGSDLYVGGSFTAAGGNAATNIAKWDGSTWSPLGSGTDSEVSALAASGSNVYAGGYFRTAGGSAASHIAKWDGISWSVPRQGSGISGAKIGVLALAVSGIDLYVGGDFTTAGGNSATSIAKWNGSSWSPFGSGMGGFAPYYPYGPSVNALTVSGSNVYAAGNFTNAGGITANSIAKWDGNNWSALGSGMGASGGNPTVFALTASGSTLYAGGLFTNAGGIPANFIAKWDGSNWSALGSGLDNLVHALAVSGDDVYVGGHFTMAGGSAATNIAKWDGSSWSALGSGLSGRSGAGVFALAMSGSNVYAAGNFTNAGGLPANSIAKWDGSSWSALGSGMNGGVFALAVCGSDLYAAGATNIAKWNGTAWSALGTGMDNATRVLAVSGSDLYAGGSFNIVGGKVSAYIARAYLPTLPTLSLFPSSVPPGGITVSWPSPDTAAFVLEQTDTLISPVTWATNGASVIDDGTNKSVTIPATNSAEFFRLRRP
jgi:hypothetical protein